MVRGCDALTVLTWYSSTLYAPKWSCRSSSQGRRPEVFSTISGAFTARTHPARPRFRAIQPRISSCVRRADDEMRRAPPSSPISITAPPDDFRGAHARSSPRNRGTCRRRRLARRRRSTGAGVSVSVSVSPLSAASGASTALADSSFTVLRSSSGNHEITDSRPLCGGVHIPSEGVWRWWTLPEPHPGRRSRSVASGRAHTTAGRDRK